MYTFRGSLCHAKRVKLYVSRSWSHLGAYDNHSELLSLESSLCSTITLITQIGYRSYLIHRRNSPSWAQFAHTTDYRRLPSESSPSRGYRIDYKRDLRQHIQLRRKEDQEASVDTRLIWRDNTHRRRQRPPEFDAHVSTLPRPQPDVNGAFFG